MDRRRESLQDDRHAGAGVGAGPAVEEPDDTSSLTSEDDQDFLHHEFDSGDSCCCIGILDTSYERLLRASVVLWVILLLCVTGGLFVSFFGAFKFIEPGERGAYRIARDASPWVSPLFWFGFVLFLSSFGAILLGFFALLNHTRLGSQRNVKRFKQSLTWCIVLHAASAVLCVFIVVRLFVGDLLLGPKKLSDETVLPHFPARARLTQLPVALAVVGGRRRLLAPPAVELHKQDHLSPPNSTTTISAATPTSSTAAGISPSMPPPPVGTSKVAMSVAGEEAGQAPLVRGREGRGIGGGMGAKGREKGQTTIPFVRLQPKGSSLSTNGATRPSSAPPFQHEVVDDDDHHDDHHDDDRRSGVKQQHGGSFISDDLPAVVDVGGVNEKEGHDNGSAAERQAWREGGQEDEEEKTFFSENGNDDEPPQTVLDGTGHHSTPKRLPPPPPSFVSLADIHGQSNDDANGLREWSHAEDSQPTAAAAAAAFPPPQPPPAMGHEMRRPVFSAADVAEVQHPFDFKRRRRRRRQKTIAAPQRTAVDAAAASSSSAAASWLSPAAEGIADTGGFASHSNDVEEAEDGHNAPGSATDAPRESKKDDSKTEVVKSNGVAGDGGVGDGSVGDDGVGGDVVLWRWAGGKGERGRGGVAAPPPTTAAAFPSLSSSSSEWGMHGMAQKSQQPTADDSGAFMSPIYLIMVQICLWIDFACFFLHIACVAVVCRLSEKLGRLFGLKIPFVPF